MMDEPRDPKGTISHLDGLNLREMGDVCQAKRPPLFKEISEKVQKSPITPIVSRLHRLEGIETKEKSVESFFKICVIKERKVVFQRSLRFRLTPPENFAKVNDSEMTGGGKMKRMLALILMGIVILFASSSCATLKKGELRLLDMEIHDPVRLQTNQQFWIRVRFEADGHPEIRRACFYWFGDGPYCVGVREVEYGSFAYFDVPLNARYGSSILQCYVEYLRDEKIERSNAVSHPINVSIP
jgi:hypothetical protein